MFVINVFKRFLFFLKRFYTYGPGAYTRGAVDIVNHIHFDSETKWIKRAQWHKLELRILTINLIVK